MKNRVLQVPLWDLIELRDAFREGRVHLKIVPEHVTPETKAWAAQVELTMLEEVEAEIHRRKHSSPLQSELTRLGLNDV